ncbi:MAG: GNAT family N-acetyltransferase [Oscillospiraceae bacterium]|nr:GNAT family N-acetyltransferase [Oscillospiraceae bacterium]
MELKARPAREDVKFMQLLQGNDYHRELFEPLLTAYHEEITPELAAQTPQLARSVIAMQGDRDRHCAIVYAPTENFQPIGFVIGKIDKPEHKGHKKVGFGYVMEFYVKPEFRRRGYGRAMFRHLERLFARDGAARMYLNTNSETGETFWRSIGFAPTDEIGNAGQTVWEKAVELTPPDAETIAIKMFEYGNTDIGRKLAAMNGRFEDYDDFTSLKYGKMSSYKQAFTIYAENPQGDAVGAVVFYLYSDPDGDSWWWMSDLDIRWDCRRNGIASKLVKAGFERLTDIGAEYVQSSCQRTNPASEALHRSLGFTEIPNDKSPPDEDFHFRYDVPHNYNLAPLQEWWQVMNVDALRGTGQPPIEENIADVYSAKLTELLADGTAHYIIRRGLAEIGYAQAANGVLAEFLVKPQFRSERLDGFLAERFSFEKAAE